MSDRIQKLIAASGYCSRRAAEKLIEQGAVSVCGRTAVIGDTAHNPGQITIYGKPLPSSGRRTYIMLNKPRGYVSTMSDEQGRKTVAELTKNVGVRVLPVGRLDIDSEGLLIMTDDGQLINRLTHPSNEVEKTYRVRVRCKAKQENVDALRALKQISGEQIRPAKVKLIDDGEASSVLLITISEGKNRQVRRMCDAVGLDVLRLKRISEGSLSLGELASGQWRYLTDAELENLQK
ncbi:MAG: rRNA pseudouridine synthase [Clostridia bacterium]|nr:rRNA pseudouridine synthase [Clostridia bacterium]